MSKEASSESDEIRCIKHYSSTQKILLVGEGDFSFSSCLASAFISASNIIATSLDSAEFLIKNYPKVAIDNIQNLRMRGSRVLREVDVGEMAHHELLKDMKFDRIIFNFPLAGFFPNESREFNILQNQQLVKGFMDNARKMLRENGEIHITHKCYGFFGQWELDDLALTSGLLPHAEVEFNCNDYPGYSPKCGFGSDRGFEFDSHSSKTYKYVLKI